MKTHHIFCFIIMLTHVVVAQKPSTTMREQSGIFVSVLTFKGIVSDSSRVDVYCSIPYEVLQFVKSANKYGARYSLQIVIRDKTGNKISETFKQEQVVEPDYNVSRGSTGRSDVSQNVFRLLPGDYSVDILAVDELSSREFKASRKVIVPNFRTYEVMTSSIMLVSHIEQRENRFIVTPLMTDNVSDLAEGFFLFFEVYNRQEYLDSVDIVCEIYDGVKQVYKGARQLFNVREERTQQYVKVKLPAEMSAGVYTLRLIVLNRITPAAYTTIDYLASSERPIVIERSIGGIVLNDIDKAIREMRYIAGQSDIDSVSAPSSQGERRLRFEAYWKSVDPTPGTIRNEAFEEYYGRVEYANKNYRSYNDGWLTDMGMISIILGVPTTTERRVNMPDNRSYVVWTYANQNRQYLFIDYSGFGDYRLSTSTPFSSLEKYRYDRR